jgi:hypothetical protein
MYCAESSFILHCRQQEPRSLSEALPFHRAPSLSCHMIYAVHLMCREPTSHDRLFGTMLDRYTTAGLSYINLDLASPFANETADPAGAARFRLAARHVASVNTGDCLWIPAYWHHEVLSSETEETLAFSLWCVPSSMDQPTDPPCLFSRVHHSSEHLRSVYVCCAVSC